MCPLFVVCLSVRLRRDLVLAVGWDPILDQYFLENVVENVVENAVQVATWQQVARS